MIKVKRKKSVGKFCSLCRCPDHLDMGGANGGNWDCPLLGDKICSVDCEIELEGGMGAPDTLKKVCERTGKTPQEVHAICVACPHGGKDLEKYRSVMPPYGEDGKGRLNDPELIRVMEETKVEWNRKIRWLQGKTK
jgi:hypothetical protein